MTAGPALASELQGDTERSEFDIDVYELADESELWPYTSREQRYSTRTLGLNLIVYGDPDGTEALLRDSPLVGDWEELEEERQDILPAEAIDGDLEDTVPAWGGADGATRWIWVNPPNGEAVWLREAYQLEDGDYLGAREHIRAYTPPGEGNWTAFQAHSEHWDWFHLRHTVHSVEDSQLYVEEEFVDRWFVDELRRERVGNTGPPDGDGWVTVVELNDELLEVFLGTLVLGLFATLPLVVPRKRIEAFWNSPSTRLGAHAALLVAGIVLTVLLVRFGGIIIERTAPSMDPKVIAAIGYPVLLIGVPVVTYLLARPLPADIAFVAGIVGFVMAVFIDYTYLGVMRIPLETFVHRAGLGFAVGVIAAGASATARLPARHRGYVRTGVLLWVVAVSLPLLQFV